MVRNLEPPTDKLPHYRGSVASRAWHPPFAPTCFGMEPPLRWRPDSRRMRSLTDRRLYKIAHPGFATIKVAPTAQVVSARRMADFGTTRKPLRAPTNSAH